MGAANSSDYSSPQPPSPRNSTLFVVRNGRYEPQSLMPRLPTSDSYDFDGFRPSGKPVRPPDMKQASLVKSPASLRRDSLTSSAMEKDLIGSENNPGTCEETCLCFTFDATRAGTLSVHLRVIESLEFPPVQDEQDAACTLPKKAPSPSPIELIPQEPQTCDDDKEASIAKENDWPSNDAADVIKKADARCPKNMESEGLVLDTFHFQAGLAQEYRSPGISVSNWPARLLGFQASRPREVPIAIRLAADPAEGEPISVQYTYASWRNAAGADAATPLWRPDIFAQKLQYGDQRFVLHEVFGVKSTTASGSEQAGETGNNECIICLSEPRDTAVLPCRHMCFCSYCAGIVRLQCDKCPVCRQKVASLLQFKRDGDNTTALDQTSPASALPPPPVGVYDDRFTSPDDHSIGASSAMASNAAPVITSLRPGSRR